MIKSICCSDEGRCENFIYKPEMHCSKARDDELCAKNIETFKNDCCNAVFSCEKWKLVPETKPKEHPVPIDAIIINPKQKEGVTATVYPTANN